MQAVCDTLEQLVSEGVLKQYAIAGAAIALAVGRPKDRARLVYLAELPEFDFDKFKAILARHGLSSSWDQWSAALGLKH
jgi:hypothetical protein